MTLIERAATAAAECYGEKWDALPEVNPVANTELDRQFFREIARAVLQAIREPTPEMCDAARKARYLFAIDRAEDDAIGWTFEAMIDAELSE